jgi:hypothetical protein
MNRWAVRVATCSIISLLFALVVGYVPATANGTAATFTTTRRPLRELTFLRAAVPRPGRPSSAIQGSSPPSPLSRLGARLRP